MAQNEVQEVEGRMMKNRIRNAFGKKHEDDISTPTAEEIPLTPPAEDYLEVLYMRDVEGSTREWPLPGDAVIGELLRRGYIEFTGESATMTKMGHQEAEHAVRRHRLAERLLHDVIDVQGRQIDQAACEFEHSLHHGVAEHICTLLGHPNTCPHGRPIPPGKCCKERKGAAKAAVVSLAEMQAGERGIIAYLSSRQSDTVQKLMALGALPGAPISIIQTFPSVVFQINQTQMAVDMSLAGDIYVRRAGE